VSLFGIPELFAWENILHEAREKEAGQQRALDRFFHSDADCLVAHFDRLFGTEKFSFDIKGKMGLQKHVEILEILDKVNMSEVDCEIDMLGWVYEQHLKTGSSSAGRDLGQFFTDRFICEYMTELCRPKFKHPGVPETVCDPSMGTGGFLTYYIKYFKKNYPDQVNWKVQEHVIHGNDTDPRVSGVARMNLFMETGGHKSTNLQTHDSLYGDLTLTGYDVILANMPFGLKGIKHADCCERVKDLKIRGTKSEPLFLQLMMVSLNLGGRCAVVVPDGMLVNSSTCHDDTRRYLLDHFELRRVIKLKGKFFMNTGIQPSVLFFENTGNPTKEIEFWDVVKGEDGKIQETMILSVPRERMDASCSLDMRRYQEVKMVANPAGFTMVKLGDISFSKKYPSHETSVGKESGSSRFHTGGEYTRLYTDNPDISDTVIIVNRTNGSGKSNIFIDSNCSVAKQTLVMSCDNITTTTYVFYWLTLNKHEIEKGYIGSTHKNLSTEFVKTMTIPLPPLSVQQEIVATLDRIYSPGTVELSETLKLTQRAMDLVLAQPNGTMLEPIVEAQRMMRKSAQMAADVRAQMAADVRAQMAAIVKSIDCRRFPVVKLGDLFDNPSIKHRYTNKDTSDSGTPFYNGCYNSPLTFVNTVNPSYTSSTDYLIMIKDGGGNHNSSTVGLGKTFIVNGSACVASQNIILVPKTSNNLKFIYYTLCVRIKDIRDLSTPSINLEHISVNTILDFEITLPPLDFQQAVLVRLDALQSQLDSLDSLSKQAEDNARFILESYLG